MSRRKIYLLAALTVLFVFVFGFFSSEDKKEAFSEKVKISLRDVGHQLLLSNNDSTSLVLPIHEEKNATYLLSLKTQFSFDPADLVLMTHESFQKRELPKNYMVEVVDCTTEEVVYSYEIKNSDELDSIACGGRILPQKCYTIEVQFVGEASLFSAEQKFLVFLFICFIFLFVADVFFKKRKQPLPAIESNAAYTEIGSFHFYPGQNKLVKKPLEINLSRKECELLEIFVANLNQIVTRDELTKKVWEDHGVFVGRSLDTYVSKLRKKLREDKTVKLINVHGVGYKLEIVA